MGGDQGRSAAGGINLQRRFQLRACVAILLLLSGCESENFTEVEKARAPLISGFESYASLKEVTAKLSQDVEVKIVADTSLAKNSSQPPYRIHTIRIAPFEHLNQPGKLLLIFFNDRLEQSSFYPEKVDSYASALAKNWLVLKIGAEVVQGNTVIWDGQDEDQNRFVGWADKRLREQRRRWLARYH